ncbi:MAG: hypothetical protein OXN79_13285 [bacterium]|nr:hypothetical protein [bacterium]
MSASAAIQESLLVASLVSLCLHCGDEVLGAGVERAVGEISGGAFADAGLEVIESQHLRFRCNRVHEPGDRDPSIMEMRRLHCNLDFAVRDAMGKLNRYRVFDILA